jgi:hypothetical protein
VAGRNAVVVIGGLFLAYLPFRIYLPVGVVPPKNGTPFLGRPRQFASTLLPPVPPPERRSPAFTAANGPSTFEFVTPALCYKLLADATNDDLGGIRNL